MIVQAGPQYDPASENQFRNEVKRQIDERVRKGDHIYLDKNKLVLRSPDGSRWALAVADDGTLSAEPFE